nr:hypothetical protein Iba_chr07fCG3170 [Ipomoea batatas]
MASVFSLAPPAASSSAVIREGARFNSAKFCRFRDGNRSNAAHISSSSSCATDSAQKPHMKYTHPGYMYGAGSSVNVITGSIGMLDLPPSRSICAVTFSLLSIKLYVHALHGILQSSCVYFALTTFIVLSLYTCMHACVVDIWLRVTQTLISSRSAAYSIRRSSGQVRVGSFTAAFSEIYFEKKMLPGFHEVLLLFQL